MPSKPMSDGADPAARLQMAEVDCGAEHGLAAYGNLIVGVSAEPPDPRLMQSVEELARSLDPRYAAGLGVVVVIDASCAPPDEDARRVVCDVYTVLRPMVRGVAYVVEGEGFAAAAKRSVLSLITMTIKPGFPIRVSGTLEEGLPWLRKTLGPAWLEPMRIQGVVETVNVLRTRIRTK